MTQPLGAAALPRFLARSAAGAAAGCAIEGSAEFGYSL